MKLLRNNDLILSVFRILAKKNRLTSLWLFVHSFSACLVCSRVSARLPLNGISWNLVLDTFVKICQGTSSYVLCQDNSNLDKIGQKYPVLYMKTPAGFICWRRHCFFISALFWSEIVSSCWDNRWGISFNFISDASNKFFASSITSVLLKLLYSAICCYKHKQLCCSLKRISDSVVHIVTWLWAGWPRNCGSILGGVKRFLLPTKYPGPTSRPI